MDKVIDNIKYKVEVDTDEVMEKLEQIKKQLNFISYLVKELRKQGISKRNLNRIIKKMDIDAEEVKSDE